VIKKVAPWFIFVGVLALLVFSESSFARTVDGLLWPVRFGLIAALSVLLLWSRWRHRADSSTKDQAATRDVADGFLSAARRWFYGEQKRPK
jgi:membrane protein implicated in regulation of membrane protease activity